MSKRHEKVPTEEAARELTRKEQLLRHRDRERHKKLYAFIFGALGLALALVLVGVVYQFLVVPNQAAAKVGDVSISTEQFWKRTKFEKNSLQGQMTRLQQLEQQFGGQGYFQSQIDQIQNTLASPYALGSNTLDTMIQDILIAKEAQKRGIAVSDQDVDAALREEVANSQGLVTEAQATATAEAGVKATATAAGWTPTPTATVDANAPVTATAPTPPEPPPAAVITDTAYTEGVAALEKSLLSASGMSLVDYKAIIRSRLLRDKLSEVIGTEKVAETEEAVHPRHILLRVTDTATNTLTSTAPAAETAPVTTTAPAAPSTAVTATAPIKAATEITATGPITKKRVALTNTSAVTGTASVTTTSAMTTSAAVTTTAAVTKTSAVTPSSAVTSTSDVTSTGAVTGTAAVTATAEVTPTATVTTTPGATATAASAVTSTAAITATAPITPPLRNDAQALALAQDLRKRILAGEDFAKLAEQYSDDTNSATKGGDLGWFAKGAMVKAFEDAAFALPLNQVSEPIKSDFGYHLIEVLEKDPNHPKDEAKLKQERAQAFQDWLTAQMGSKQIERTDVNSILPSGL